MVYPLTTWAYDGLHDSTTQLGKCTVHDAGQLYTQSYLHYTVPSSL